MKRCQCIFKTKTTLTVFTLLLIALAFANFFILLSLRTSVHGNVDSLFFIHIQSQRNLSVFEQYGVDLLATKDIEKTYTPTKTVNKTESQIDVKVDKKVSVQLSERKPKTENYGRIPKSLETQQTHSLLGKCTVWCYRGDGLKPPYLLTAVLLVRIYTTDLAKLSSREMIQWFQYLRYAGFQHVYVYDAYVKPTESQRDVIQPFVQSGFATYIDWSVHNPYSIQGTQVSAYQDCIDKFGKDSQWQAAIDIDEYPFSPRDTNENFMARFLGEYSRNNPDVSEITMKNYLFLGKPIDDASEPLLIARIRRRTHRPANPLVKPIYKPKDIAWAQVHHNGVRSGSSMDSPEELLRMNHYWGARLQNWGDDTPKVLKMTQPDYSIEPIVKRIKQCASCLGNDGLYHKRWA